METKRRAVSWMPRLDPGQAKMKFVMDKVALGQVFLKIIRFTAISIIPPVLRTRGAQILGARLAGHLNITRCHQMFFSL
jgi:hypothetical protein